MEHARHTSNGPWLTEEPSTYRNVKYTRTDLLVPPSNDDTRAESILVLIANILENAGSHRNWREGAMGLSNSPQHK